jgi:hypothetical protein
LQELPKGKDFGSIFCRFDGPNPDLLPDPKPVITVVTIVTIGLRQPGAALKSRRPIEAGAICR